MLEGPRRLGSEHRPRPGIHLPWRGSFLRGHSCPPHPERRSRLRLKTSQHPLLMRFRMRVSAPWLADDQSAMGGSGMAAAGIRAKIVAECCGLEVRAPWRFGCAALPGLMRRFSTTAQAKRNVTNDSVPGTQTQPAFAPLHDGDGAAFPTQASKGACPPCPLLSHF